MRVLMINKFFDLRGGSERVMFDLDAGLRERGHEVLHFAQQDPRNEPSAYAAYFPPARDYDRGGAWNGLRLAAAAIHDRRARRHLARLLDEHPVDVAHLHNIYHQLSPSILGELRARGIPTLMTVHDYKLICPNYKLHHHGSVCERCVGRTVLWQPLRYRCQRDSLAESALVAVESTWHRLSAVYARGVDCFVAPSEFLAERLRRQRFEVRVIRNAPRAAGAAAALHERAQEPTLLYAGRLSEEKGVGLLLEAARDLSGLQLRIAGDGPLAEPLRAAASQNVRFLGRLSADELSRELARCWAVAVPSTWYENAPLAVLEAFAAARPVLVSDHGGLVELVDDAREGWRLAPGGLSAWREALGRIPQSADELGEMGRRARLRLERDHDFGRLLDEYLGLYDSLRSAARS